MQIDALLKDFVVKADLEDFIFLGITNKNVLYFRVMHLGERLIGGLAQGILEDEAVATAVDNMIVALQIAKKKAKEADDSDAEENAAPARTARASQSCGVTRAGCGTSGSRCGNCWIRPIWLRRVCWIGVTANRPP